ncbi:hypothetical protein R1flu_008575 [Riccia fluitans]|uniref:Uncharacterized protein n=1 Tax=Riccia fluitans TaxID=41844 RepID=A0ABD1YCB5_9MARC
MDKKGKAVADTPLSTIPKSRVEIRCPLVDPEAPGPWTRSHDEVLVQVSKDIDASQQITAQEASESALKEQEQKNEELVASLKITQREIGEDAMN